MDAFDVFVCVLFGLGAVCCAVLCFSEFRVVPDGKHKFLSQFVGRILCLALAIVFGSLFVNYIHAKATETETDITEGFEICAYMRVEEADPLYHSGKTDLMYKITYNEAAYEVKATQVEVGDSTVLHIINIDSDSPRAKLTISRDVKEAIQLQSQTIRIGE